LRQTVNIAKLMKAVDREIDKAESLRGRLLEQMDDVGPTCGDEVDGSISSGIIISGDAIGGMCTADRVLETGDGAEKKEPLPPVSIEAALTAKPGKVKPGVSDMYFGPLTQDRTVTDDAGNLHTVVVVEGADGHVYVSGATGSRTSALGRPIKEADAEKYGLTGWYAADKVDKVHAKCVDACFALIKGSYGSEADPLKKIILGYNKDADAALNKGQYGRVLALYQDSIYKGAFDLLTDISCDKFVESKEDMNAYIGRLEVAYDACALAADIGVEAAGALGKLVAGPVAGGLAKGAMSAFVSHQKGEPLSTVIIQASSAIVSGVCSGMSGNVVSAALDGMRQFVTDLFKQAAKNGGSVTQEEVLLALARGLAAGIASGVIGGGSKLDGGFAADCAKMSFNKAVDYVIETVNAED
jgi:hypothetical protein